MWTKLKIIAALNQCIIISLLIMQHVPPHPQAFCIQGFPLIAQPDDISCGPTSCTMLLHYLDKPIDVPQAKKIANTVWLTYHGKEIGMTLPKGIAAILQSTGVPAQVKHGNIELLKYHISKNKPPIVLIRSGYKTWHYVVAIGYTKDSIIVADPGGGIIETMPQQRFVGAWKFTHDMSGEKMPDIDPYFEIVRLADVYGGTFIVPNHRNFL